MVNCQKLLLWESSQHRFKKRGLKIAFPAAQQNDPGNLISFCFPHCIKSNFVYLQLSISRARELVTLDPQGS